MNVTLGLNDLDKNTIKFYCNLAMETNQEFVDFVFTNGMSTVSFKVLIDRSKPKGGEYNMDDNTSQEPAVEVPTTEGGENTAPENPATEEAPTDAGETPAAE